MRNERIDILSYLVEIYKDFYTHKDLFKTNFKYAPNEIENFYEEMQTSFEAGHIVKSDTKETMSDDVRALKTADDVKEFLSKYYSDNGFSKDDLIKNLSLKEFDYLFISIKIKYEKKRRIEFY
jgi:hypothetical protein